jgi:hypothetical protein
VDYEDEDEDVPARLGTNGKGRVGMFEQKSDSLLSTLPIADPIWPDMEDVTTAAKRKTPVAPSITETDAAACKRQKAESDGETVSHLSDLGAVKGMKDLVLTVSEHVSSAETSVSETQQRMLTTPPTYLTAVPTAISDGNDITSVPLNNNEHSVYHESLDMFQDEVETDGSSDVVLNVDYVSSNGPTSTNDPVSIPDGLLQASSNGPLNDAVAAAGVEAATRHMVETLSTTTCPSENREMHSGGGIDSAATGDTTGMNGHKAKNKTGEVVECNVAERFATENGTAGVVCLGENCNGAVAAGIGDSERIGGGEASKTGFSESNSDSTQQSVSIGSEAKKLAGLGSDLMRAVSPSSPGSYTVR